MPEVYWLGGANWPSIEDVDLTGLLDTLFRQAGAPAAEIEEVHWTLDPRHERRLITALQKSGLAEANAPFGWPEAPLLDHYLLHTTSQSILAGERSLCLLGQSIMARSAAVLLTSPQWVGKRNLLPRARLAHSLSLPMRASDMKAVFHTIRAQLEEREVKLDTIRWLSINGLSLRDGDPAPQAFAQARWLEIEPGAGDETLWRLNHMVAKLEQSGSDAGLVMTFQPRGPVLAALVELI